MSALVVVYGGVEMKGKRAGLRSCLTITKDKYVKDAKKMAKKRDLSMVVVSDKKVQKSLEKLKIYDGYNKEKKFLMVPFAGAEKFMAVYDLVKDIKHETDSKLTAKVLKSMKGGKKEEKAEKSSKKEKPAKTKVKEKKKSSKKAVKEKASKKKKQ